MKNNFFIFIAASLLFISCANDIQSPNSESSVNEESSVTTGEIIKYVSIQGIFTYEGIDTSGSSRTAIPDLSASTNYYAIAKCGNDVRSSIVSGNNHLDLTITGNTYLIKGIPATSDTKKWTVEFGIRTSSNSSVTIGSTTNKIMCDTKDANISSAFPVYVNDFILKPVTQGTGSVNLEMTVPAKVSRVTAQVGQTNWGPTITVGNGETTKTVNIESSSMNAGIYNVTFSFFNEADMLLYRDKQSVNILQGCTTNKWINNGGDGLITDGAYILTEQNIKDFVRKTFYVGNTLFGNASSSNSGTSVDPVLTLGDVEEIIKKRNDSNANYTIFISGTLTGKQSLSDGINGKATSITICGATSETETDGTPKNKIQGTDSTTALSISTTVSITLENLKITGGKRAIESVSDITLAGNVEIPGGTGNSNSPLNDILVPTGKTVILSSTFTATSGIKITPEVPAKKTKLISGSINTTNLSKFTLNQASGFKLAVVTESGKNYGILGLENIITSIYVASTGTDSYRKGGYEGSNPSGNTNLDSTWNNSTYAYNHYTNNSAKPFASIEKAMQFITYQESASNYTIYIDGVLKGAQSIANNSDTNNPIRLAKTASGDLPATATKIVLTSKNTQTSHTAPQDFINCNVSGASTTGTTLTIGTDVPVDIQNLGITGGNKTGDGGGINITNSSAVVTLYGRTKVYGNTASGNGGGIYNGGDKLFIYGNVIIGEALSITAPPESTTAVSTGRNSAVNGGGIYNNGTLYLGYSAVNTYADWGGGIVYNYASTSGGGIYSNESKYIYMARGKISYNQAGTSGGGIYSNTSTICFHGSSVVGTNRSDNTFPSNSSRSNQAPSGGGIYSVKGTIWLGYKTAGSTQELTGGILGNYASNYGAGIYASGTSITMATGNISYNATPSTNSSKKGGGIYMEMNSGSGLLHIAGGTIHRNASYTGGGVYSECPVTMSNGTIGDSSKNQPAQGGSNNCSNYGNDGGGIYLNSSGDSNFNGGTIIYNSGSGGGAIQIRGGGNVTVKNSLQYNHGTFGGAIYVGEGNLLLDTGANFIQNEASASSGAGGAIYVAFGTVSIKGNVSIPCSGVKQNDVYLYEENNSFKTIKVTGGLEGAGVVATLTPKKFEAGRPIIDPTSTNLSQVVSRFALTDTNWVIDTDGTLKKKTLTVADITTSSQISQYENQFQSSTTHLDPVNLSTLQGKLIFFRLASNQTQDSYYGVLSFQNLSDSSVDYSFKRFINDELDTNVSGSGTITFSDYPNFADYPCSDDENYFCIAIGISGSYTSFAISCDDMCNGDVFINKDDDDNYTFSAGMCGNSYGDGYPDWAGYYILSQ